MMLTLDIGNSNVKAGRFDAGALRQRWTVPVTDAPAQRLAEWLAGGRVERVAAATVVPALAEGWLDAARSAGVELELICPGADLMPVCYQPPESLGIDRLLAALAARERYGAPVLIADLGTATTLDAVDAGGAFRGGAILCGLGTARDALAAAAAQLPPARLEPPTGVLGRCTSEALDIGLLVGHLEAIAGLARRMRAELGVEAPLVGTGGWAECVARAEPGLFGWVEPDLVLHGLRLAAERG